jgi:hypothetical protein
LGPHPMSGAVPALANMLIDSPEIIRGDLRGDLDTQYKKRGDSYL